MTMNEGWKCPVCNRGVRPDKDTCDHGAQYLIDMVIGPTRSPDTTGPGTAYPPGWTWPGTTCGGVTVAHDPNIVMVN